MIALIAILVYYRKEDFLTIKVPITILFLLCLLAAGAPALPSTILGGWQSTDCSPEPPEGCPLIWKEYGANGKVWVIYGKTEEIKRTYVCDYQIEESRLEEICPFEEPISYAVRLEKDSLRLRWAYVDEDTEERQEWELRLVRQAEPSAALAGMPEMPKTLPEVFSVLKEVLSKKFLESVTTADEEDFIARAHFGLGLWMRNSFGLWARFELAREFEQMGVHHPDEMSAIILTTLWRLIHEQPLKLEDQIRSDRLDLHEIEQQITSIW